MAHEYQEKMEAVELLDKQLGTNKPVEQQFKAQFTDRLTRMFVGLMSLDGTIQQYEPTQDDLNLIAQTAINFDTMLQERRKTAIQEAAAALEHEINP